MDKGKGTRALGREQVDKVASVNGQGQRSRGGSTRANWKRQLSKGLCPFAPAHLPLPICPCPFARAHPRSPMCSCPLPLPIRSYPVTLVHWALTICPCLFAFILAPSSPLHLPCHMAMPNALSILPPPHTPCHIASPYALAICPRHMPSPYAPCIWTGARSALACTSLSILFLLFSSGGSPIR